MLRIDIKCLLIKVKMFSLSENKNNYFIKNNLLGFFKCSICLKTPKRLGRVCEDGHFHCESCALMHISGRMQKCCYRPCKKALTRMRRLTVFNSMLDVVLSTPIDSFKFIKNLEEVWECPVCFEETVTSPNICSSGHSMCSRCLTFTKRCPLCRGLFEPNYRIVGIKRKLNDALSSIPCCNHSCDAISNYRCLTNHNDKCRFVSWSCGDKYCSWVGNITKTSMHANEFHSTSILKGRKGNMTLRLDNNIHLQLWNRNKDLYYKIIYKMTAQGLRLGIYCHKIYSRREVIMLYFNYGKTSHRYVVPYVESDKNPSYLFAHESPKLVLVNDIVAANKPFLECLLRAEQSRSQKIMFFIIKAALLMIKFLLL